MTANSMLAEMADSYPNGWFVVAFSRDVRPGKVVNSRLADEDLVVYRTRSGVLRAIRPTCPHLGAHLGHGGRIEGEDLVCPFHAFAFGPDGQCVRNSYGTAPPRAGLQTVPVREANGMVFAWYHGSGAEPDWQVPEIPADGYPKPSHWVRTMGGHPLDLCENSLDIGHFSALHHGGQVQVLKPATPDGHRLTAEITFAGFYYLSRLRAEFSIQMYGVGYLAVAVTFPQLRLDVLELCSWTPVGGDRQRFHKTTYAKIGSLQSLPAPLRRPAAIASTPLAGLVSRGSVQQIGVDEKVWRHRRYLEHPKLAHGDGPIMKYRRWAGQFFGTGVDAGTAQEPGGEEPAEAKEPSVSGRRVA